MNQLKEKKFKASNKNEKTKSYLRVAFFINEKDLSSKDKVFFQNSDFLIKIEYSKSKK